jgi:hypothetical protein
VPYPLLDWTCAIRKVAAFRLPWLRGDKRAPATIIYDNHATTQVAKAGLKGDALWLAAEDLARRHRMGTQAARCASRRDLRPELGRASGREFFAAVDSPGERAYCPPLRLLTRSGPVAASRLRSAA